jgi:hypothetical protein
MPSPLLLQYLSKRCEFYGYQVGKAVTMHEHIKHSPSSSLLLRLTKVMFLRRPFSVFTPQPPTPLFPIGIRVSQRKTLKAERAASCPFNIRETCVRRSAMLGRKVEIIGFKDKDFMYP